MSTSQTVTPGAGGALYEHGQLLQQGRGQVAGADTAATVGQPGDRDLSIGVQYLMHLVPL